jgi:hypothetical protein
MADPVLHIKDAYFFEVPKFLWKRNFQSKADVASVSPVWVELDDQFQDWEFHRQYEKLTGSGKEEFGLKLPPEETAHTTGTNGRTKATTSANRSTSSFSPKSKSEKPNSPSGKLRKSPRRKTPKKNAIPPNSITPTISHRLSITRTPTILS